MPEVVVLGDRLTSGHDVGGDVGDVALEPDQRLCPGQAGLIEGAGTGADFDEPGGLGRAFAVDDGLGAGLLGVQGSLVAPCSFG